jgi:ADP-ribose diphosphatase
MIGMDNWQIKNRKIAFDHPWIRIIVDDLQRDGKTKPYIFLESPVDSVATVALMDDHQIVLTRQYRHPVGRIITDLPAGRANPGEDPLEGARRELREETGYAPGDLIALGKASPFPGSLKVTMHLFFAKNLTYVGQSLDDDEELEVYLRPFDEVYQGVLSGEYIDTALQWGVLAARAKGLA